MASSTSPQHTAKVPCHPRRIRICPVGNAVPGVPRSTRLDIARSRANPHTLNCRERACPFRAAHGPTWKNPGECATRLRLRPGLSDIGAFPAGRGKPLPYGGDACEFAQYCGKLGRCCAARRVGAPYNVDDANSPDMVTWLWCCCAERRGRRSLPGVCGFAIGGSKPFPSAAEAVGDAGPYRCRCLLFPPSFPQRGKVASADPPRGG